MHASSSAILAPARSVATSTHTHATAHSSIPSAPSVAAACSVADSESCTLAASSPQCCHCGWRGAHAPTCPFK
ncbi:hypothetical protein C8Q70DRAFT_996031 [Cubamyces menziesii]|nr:hypothetical protein C8Q70DRAFT_996031 [Cubamyces menziesii]